MINEIKELSGININEAKQERAGRFNFDYDPKFGIVVITLPATGEGFKLIGVHRNTLDRVIVPMLERGVEVNTNLEEFMKRINDWATRKGERIIEKINILPVAERVKRDHYKHLDGQIVDDEGKPIVGYKDSIEAIRRLRNIR
jgi:hypothetical protein